MVKCNALIDKVIVNILCCISIGIGTKLCYQSNVSLTLFIVCFWANELDLKYECGGGERVINQICTERTITMKRQPDELIFVYVYYYQEVNILFLNITVIINGGTS